MSKQISGGCLCGAVHFKVDGDPVFAAFCHCKDCQKYTGTGHAAPMAFPESAVTITGATKSYTKTADSGNTITRNFCPNCGSPVFNTLALMPGVVIVPAGALDDPNEYEPAIAIYTSRAPKWDSTNDAVAKFPEGPPMG